MRVFNFSAGPAMMPTPVMEKAQDEFLNYHGVGSGIMELSHRGRQFMEVIERAESNIREIMDISDDYSVLFIQGGASLQFAMIPMNLMLADGVAEYADTGTWSAKAIEQAELFGKVNVTASSKSTKYDRIPEIRHWKPVKGSSYLHITSNNTVAGTQYHSFPDISGFDGPLVADMSSDIMSRYVEVNQFGLIYAGAQKNLGPSGVTLVIMRNDLAERVPANVPTMLKYKTYMESKSLYNTPPTFAIYMIALVADWIKEQGGIGTIEEINDMKSEALYETIDTTDFYMCPVVASNRSKMNVVFRLPTEDLEAKFIKEAEIEGMTGLKGHRSVGGIRASIYNSMPLAGVEKLIDFMNEFERVNG